MKYPTCNILRFEPKRGTTHITIHEASLLPSVPSIRSAGTGPSTGNPPLVERRNSAEFDTRGYFLNEGYDWVIVQDSEGELVLVPLKKE